MLLEPTPATEKGKDQSKEQSEKTKNGGDSKPQEGPKGDLMNQLVGMGFDEQRVRDILAKNPKTRDEALEFILNVGSQGQFSGLG